MIFPILFIWLLKVALKGIGEVMGQFLDVNGLAIGFAAFLVHVMAFSSCLTVVVRENIDGTMDRMFVFTFRRVEILFGYVIGYSAMVAIQIPVILASVFLFFDIKAAPGGLAVSAAALFLLGLISIGLALICSNFAASESQVMAFVPLIMVPALLFTDMLFPIQGAPKYFQILGCLTPMKYVLAAMKSLLIAHEHTHRALRPLIELFIYAAFTLTVGSVAFREKAKPSLLRFIPKT
jgi:ABC-type multidrug transport system permease subunit